MSYICILSKQIYSSHCALHLTHRLSTIKIIYEWWNITVACMHNKAILIICLATLTLIMHGMNKNKLLSVLFNVIRFLQTKSICKKSTWKYIPLITYLVMNSLLPWTNSTSRNSRRTTVANGVLRTEIRSFTNMLFI